MRKGTVAAWIGLSALLGTGIGLLLRTQMVVGAKLANAAIIEVKRQPSEVLRRIVIGESEQKPDAEHGRP